MKNPPGIELSLQLAHAHPYREGELIRAQIKVSGPGIVPPSQSPLEKWQYSGFLLDPSEDCGSLASPCFHPTTVGFGMGEPMSLIRETPDPQAVSLNNYLPALRPGRYRVALLLRKFVLARREPLSATYGYADPPQYAVSNTEEFEVIPATETWINQTAASSAANLRGPEPDTSEKYKQRRVAAEQLRFLDAPAGWSAALAALPVERNILLRGLETTREPARVCRLM